MLKLICSISVSCDISYLVHSMRPTQNCILFLEITSSLWLVITEIISCKLYTPAGFFDLNSAVPVKTTNDLKT